MTNILTECANKIVDKLIILTIAEARNFCCFKRIVEDFEKEKGELKAKLITVEKDVADAKVRAEDIRADVTHWKEQAEKLIEEDTETKMTCFLGRCPNCIKRYCRGKKLAQKTDDIRELLKKGQGNNFESVGRAPNLPGVEDRPSQGYIHFESRGSEYTELLDALADDNNYMTGLQGMGGTGKTTMATEVGKKLQKSKKFDHVIFTTVSNAPDVKKIQDEIAAPFSLELKEKSEAERHKILWKALTNGRKILIILDDVWENIDFSAIGIPTCDDHSGCKFLLITRNVRVCHSMECHRIIQLELLSEQDSWTLFKKHAGISDNSSKNLQDKGQDIAKECKGLPVAIAAVAKTLKGQALVEWDAALNALQDSMPMHNVDENLIEVYKCLRYSYNNMKSETAKGLFLLCSVFPEDEEIPIEILTRYGIGLGLVGEVDKYHTARRQVVDAKKKLVESCLLLETKNGCVKMHDLVREVALWITNKEIQVVMLSDKKKALVGKKNIRYLLCYGQDIDIFSSWFDGTKLEILLVYIESKDYVKVPNAFFQKMIELRVLYLSYHSWLWVALSLPKSIQSLMNIRSLFLENWKLGDISILGTLRSLETLDLDNCLISELPNKITELEKLILLNLKWCEIERNNPFEVIERCLSLEELYFNNNQVSFLDSINEAEAIDQNRTTFPTLQRYYLQKVVEMDDSISRCVCLRNIEAFVSEATFMYLVQRAEILKLEGIKGAWRNLIPEIVPMEDEGMNDLVKLGLKSCSKVQCLIDNTRHIYSHVQNVFSKLVGLELEKMDNLEELCSGPYPLDFLKSLESLSIDQCEHLRSILIKSKLNLCNLKIMELKGCPMLASVFQLSTARSLVLLEKLEICECEQLINIITDERSGDEKGEEIVDVDNDYKSCGSMFPKLKSLEIGRCNRLEFVFPVIFSGDVPLLETIKISDCGKLKYIFGRYQHEDQYLHQEVKDVVLGSLKMLLSGLPNFIDIFPECYHPMSSSVKKSSSRDGSKAEQSDPNKHNIFPWSHICCYPQKYRPKLRSATSTNIPVVSKDGLPDCSTSSGLQTSNSDCLHPFESAQYLSKQSQILRNIREIELHDLQEIKSIFILSIAPTMFLEILKIEECHGLKQIDIGDDRVGNDKGTVFPKLKELSIKYCDKLEYIFGQRPDDHQNYNEIHIHLPALEKLHLQNLPNVISVCPKSHRVTWPSMKVFHLIVCPQFRVTSTSDSNGDLDARQLDLISTTKDLRGIGKHFHALENLSVTNLNLESIFRLDELQVIGLQTSLGLQFLTLKNLPQMTYIYVGPKNSLTLQNLKELRILRSGKLEVIFPASILRCLPQLATLEIQECKELKQIIEEDVKNQELSNLHSPQPCFPNLTKLVVRNCNMLKRLISVSASNELPKLQRLVIDEASELEDVFGREQGDFPNLTELVVRKCNKLKRLISVSASNELPKLQFLEIDEASELEDVFGCEQGDFPNLTKLVVRNCNKLKRLISVSASNKLPKLQRLVIDEASELEDVFGCEQGDFPNLTEFVVRKCHKLKRLISVSASIELPKLQLLEIDEASELEDVFGCEQGDAIGELKVELPKLNILIFKQLPSLCRGIALQTVRYRFVHNCPKLSLTSSATLGEIKHYAMQDLDWDDLGALLEMLYRITTYEDASNQSPAEETTPEIEAASSSELPSSQINTNLSMQAACNQNDNGIESGEFVSVETITKGTPDQEFSPIASLNLIESNEESEKEFVGKVPGSEIPDIATSPTNSELITRPSPIPLDIPLHETHSHELVDEQSMSESCLMHQQQQLGQTQITIEIPQENYCLKEAEDQRIQESSRSEKTITAILSSDSETRNTSPIPLLPSLEKCIKRGVEEGSTSENAKIVTSSFHSEPPSSLSGQLVTSQRKTYPQSIKRGVEEGSTLENANQNDNGIQSDEFIFVETITKRTLDQEFSHNASPNLAESNEESEKEFVGKVPGSEIPDIVTSPTNSELIRGPSRSPLDIPLHETHIHELVDEQVIGESCLMIQQQPLRETQITIEIPEGNNCLKEAEDQSTQENTSPVPLLPFLEKIIKRGVEEGTASVNAKIVTSSTRSEPPSSLSGQLVTSQRITYPHSENMLSQTETFTNKEREGDPMSIQDFGDDDDLISLFQSMEEDGDDQIPTPSVSVVAMEHLTTKDNFVAKVLTDLEVSLKMPLKDIASSEANGLRLLTPLKFLSRLLLEDVTLSDGLKATIDSLHQEFPSILCSFKQAFATTNKFAMLEDKEKTIKEELAEKKKAAITIVSKISKAKKFMDEAQQKKAISKEQIIRLEKEIKDCEADLSSLQEEKKKCVAETRGYKKEFETVRKDKSQMVEDQRKAQHELYEIDYKWSSLCSQFELNRIATRNLS